MHQSNHTSLRPVKEELKGEMPCFASGGKNTWIEKLYLGESKEREDENSDKALVFSPQSLSCVCGAAGRRVWWCLQGKAKPYSCRHWELVVWPQQNTSYSPLPCCLLCPYFDASHLCTRNQASSASAVMKPAQMGD